MFQFSIYTRHCTSRENLQVHLKRVKKFMPPKGNIGLMCITDRQFGEIEVYNCRTRADQIVVPQQLELF